MEAEPPVVPLTCQVTAVLDSLSDSGGELIAVAPRRTWPPPETVTEGDGGSDSLLDEQPAMMARTAAQAVRERMRTVRMVRIARIGERYDEVMQALPESSFMERGSSECAVGR